MSKEEAKEFSRKLLKASQNKAMLYRLAGIAIVTLGFVFFVGLGSQNVIQYVVLAVMLAAAYLTGQSDMREKYEIQSVNELSQMLEEADRITVQIAEDGEEDDTIR